MKFVCPLPWRWSEIYQALKKAWGQALKDRWGQALKDRWEQALKERWELRNTVDVLNDASQRRQQHQRQTQFWEEGEKEAEEWSLDVVRGDLSQSQMEVFEEEEAKNWKLDVIPEEILMDGTLPPLPPILGAWHYTSDFEKSHAWKATVAWAKQNDLEHLIPELTNDQKYMVDEMTTGSGVFFGVARSWRCEPTDVPSVSDVLEALEKLKREWDLVAGKSLASMTRPLRFTGRKSERVKKEL